MKNYPIHSDTLARANRLANRAARKFTNPPRAAIIQIRDEFITRIHDRIERAKTARWFKLKYSKGVPMVGTLIPQKHKNHRKQKYEKAEHDCR